MICYRDMTFCDSDCVNSKCHRFISTEILKGAVAWGGPIARQDMSPYCPDYQKPEEDEE